MSAHCKQELQKHVFMDEKCRLVDCVKVEETKNRRKKFGWLVLTIDNSSRVQIHWIKAKDYTRKLKWKLQDVKTVDLCYKDGKDTSEFEMHLDSLYKWSATSIGEKDSFARSLYRYSRRLLPANDAIRFKNYRSDLFEDLQMSAELAAKLQATDGGRDLDVATDYQALSAKEESDLEALMVKYEFAISNAEAFTEQLNRELSSLDATNVHAIMESERKVQGLMDMFDTVIGEVTHLEGHLDAYDALLREVRDSVLRMEEKDAVIHVQNDNIERLRQLLEGIITRRDLIHEHEMTLLGPKDLDTEEGLARCAEAAMALEEAMSVPMHPALSEMTAVKDRNNSLENLKKCFSRCLSHYINDQLIKISVDYESGTRRTMAVGEPVLRKHEFVHNSLRPFSTLMSWLKRNDDNTYQFIKNNYLDRFGQIYRHEIIVFFEQANAKLRFEESRSASGTLDTKKGTLVLNAQEGVVSTPTKQRTTCLLGMASDLFCAGEDEVARQMFDLFLERILTSLEPAYLAEQHFCIQFLDLTTQKGCRHDGGDGLGVLDGSAMSSGSRTPSKSTSVDELDSVSRTSSDEILSRLKKRDRDIGQEVRDVMAKLFGSLEEKLLKFVGEYDQVYSMYLLVRLCHHTIQTQDAGSYLCKLYGIALVNAKRNFDQYMTSHINSIADAKPPRRNKCGIISFVSNFEEFANQCEVVFKGSDRKGDLKKWYSKIVHAIFEGIVRISMEHGKTPPEVVCMENYHHMHDSLYKLKILEEDRKEAKDRYNKALKSYVTNYFGRPLEKLNVFFDGVQARLDTGTKKSDVCFIHQYSKSELRKVIHEFPGKEVKKGLEALYKKVEKHLCPEENLLQVVWRDMQDEFIRQYKAIQTLLDSCYSGSMIQLEFSITDLLEYFSDIAKQH